jgi:serine/threonine-protein kinase
LALADVQQDIADLDAGAAVGPYELVAPIGAGGMARVWAARVRGTADVVALKMLLPQLAEHVEFRKMFFDEARIASRVRHPNVCSTFEMGEQQGMLYLAMEWLDGPSLMRVLRPGLPGEEGGERIAIRPRIAARIVADACAGLHAAHELLDEDGRSLAVVHRDVSPHNLLMTCAGDVKITDFGIAKALGKSHMTIAGQLKGKLAYMAPEQLVGGPIDRRCDVFALGCVLYEITTGRRPFLGEHDPEVMSSIMLGRYDPPAAIVPSYPPQLSLIVVRALASAPEDRYASAEEMRQALEAYLRASGPQVGAAQVAALVTERCGAELDTRAASMRSGGRPPGDARAVTWVPAPPKSASESGDGAMMIDRRSVTARRPMLWLAAAAVVGASLGAGVLSFVRTTRKPGPRAVAAESVDVERFAAGSPGGRGSAAAGGAGSALDRVRLQIVPATAIVVVDGKTLPRGTVSVAKPKDGSTVSVLVRADDHEDAVVRIDSATPDDVKVTLAPHASAAGTSSTADAAPPSKKPRSR